MVAKFKERSLIWDNYKGILIFLVVFAHFLYAHSVEYPSGIVHKVVTFIYLFHMPAFVFCSGYFSSSDNSRSKKSIVKLLVYYVIFNLLMMLYMHHYNEKEFIFLSPYNSYWYLLSLALWRLSIKYLDKVKYIIPISLLLALAVGFHSEFSNVLSIKRTIVFFPFFLLGYRLAKGQLSDKFNRFLNTRSSTFKFLMSIFVIVYSIIVYFVLVKFKFTSSMLLMGSYHHNRDVIYRVLIFTIALVFMFAILLICPNRKIPVITKAGKNSLGIYVFHRFFTYEFLLVFLITKYSSMLLIYAFIAAFLCVLVFGTDVINKWLNARISSIADSLIEGTRTGKIIEVATFATVIVLLLYKPTMTFINTRTLLNSNSKTVSLNIDKTNYLTDEMQKQIQSSIKISYVGDLILLKDQVTSAYNKKTRRYEFDDIFAYTKPYFESSDYSIGVFEGPMAGTSVPYSTSNYADGVKLYLNFPDSFAKSVKDSGIDFVTTANNHLLDRGYEGAMRTLDVLDKYGLKHTGSYRNKREKNELTIIDVKGVKIAVLSYTWAMNYYSINSVYNKYPNLTSVIPPENSKIYNKVYNEIKNDFKRAKASNADLIMVMPHMGTQFIHKTNAFQKKWNKIFASLGADIILGDHSHAVQPIQYIGNTVVVNCPGNFANSYVKYDGDATAIVNLYIDKNDKKVIATDVIPMYTQEFKDGYYRALPIYDIMTDGNLYSSMSKYELHRVEEVSKTITKVMIDRKISLDNIQDRYFYINNNYYVKSDFKNVVATYKDKKLYQLIDSSKSVVFIGDSITEGTMNNHHPYYEPLMDAFQGKKITNISKGSYTTKMIIRDYKQQIATAKGDLVVIALGTNDVRYRNKKTSALTSKDYVEQIDNIIKYTKRSNYNSKVVLIAPWFSLNDDDIARLSPTAKKKLMKEFGRALEQYAIKNNYLYIDPNDYLEKEVIKDRDKYMMDFIHPNDGFGIRLYSEAILHESK